MAKKQRKGKAIIPEGERRKKMAVPAGMKRVPSKGAGEFWNPEPEDTLTGTLGGTTTIKDQRKQDVERYTLLTDGGQLLILPNHYDLHQQLEQISQENGGSPVGVRVWIGFEGFEPANVPGGKLARYVVAVEDGKE